MRIALLVLAILAYVAENAVGQTKVWVVDPSGSITKIQRAINVATDGDTVLVKSGNYSGFTINDKSVNVVADTNATVWIFGSVRVTNLAPNRVAVLAGLRVVAAIVGQSGLFLANDVGSVRVEGCTLRGYAGQDPTYAMHGAGAESITCADVSFVRCVLQGGSTSSTNYPGGQGLRATSSRVAVCESTVCGGWHGQSSGFACQAGPGGDGAQLLTSTFLFSSHSTFAGGYGGAGLAAGFGCGCGGSGGDGGNGLSLYGSSTAKLLDSTFFGGAGGAKECGPCSSCPAADGVPGQPIVGSGATILSGTSRYLTAQNPVRELASFTVTASGVPGDHVIVWVTPTTKFRWVPTFAGVQFNRVMGPPRSLGTVGANGSVARTFSWPDLGAGVDCRNVFLQAAMRDPTGSFTFTDVVSMVVLDQAF